MSDLPILFPEPEHIELAGRRVAIRPIKLRDLERYGKTAAALVELLGSASVQQINRWAASNARDVRAILRATTSLNRWQLWRLPGSVAAQLLVEVVRVNSGFFGEALPAMARALAGQKSPSA